MESHQNLRCCLAAALAPSQLSDRPERFPKKNNTKRWVRLPTFLFKEALQSKPIHFYKLISFNLAIIHLWPWKSVTLILYIYNIYIFILYKCIIYYIYYIYYIIYCIYLLYIIYIYNINICIIYNIYIIYIINIFNIYNIYIYNIFHCFHCTI